MLARVSVALLTARGAHAAGVVRPVLAMNFFSNLGAAWNTKAKEIPYAALPGLPESFAREAGEHALAGRTPVKSKDGYAIATFAAGCFWGVELEFQRVSGVVATASGYVQGHLAKPTYEQISRSGHTEAVQLIYDPGVVSYANLCDVFWKRLGVSATRYQQVGNDVGPQYRSGIYTVSAEQLDVARASLQAEQKKFSMPIQTEVEPMRGVFWPAEDYHQRYLELGGRFNRPQSAAKGDATPIRCYG